MVWNFGMTPVDFQAPRQDSQPIRSYNENEWNDYKANWDNRLADLLSMPPTVSVSREYLPTAQWSEGLNIRGGPWAPVSDMGRPQFINGWQSETFGPKENSTMYGHDDGGVYMQRSITGEGPSTAPLYRELAQTEADFANARERQARQQQAYAQQTGGGFVGGLINESYSDPFAGQITGAPSQAGADPALAGVSMPWGQPWGTPGFGGPQSSASVGGYGQSPASQQGAQAPGWGGPFGNRNPWSPA